MSTQLKQKRLDYTNHIHKKTDNTTIGLLYSHHKNMDKKNEALEIIVERKLLQKPKLRDDDPALYLEIVKELGIGTRDVYRMLILLPYSTIRALRQKLQRNNELTRWKMYQKRMTQSIQLKNFMKRTSYLDRLKNFFK